MIPIFPDQLLGTVQTQHQPAKLIIGQQLLADIVGPTRHGVSVRIGQDTFLLKTSSKLAGAGTITLKVTQSPSETVHKVRIVAENENPLSKPVTADLVTRPATIPPQAPASTIVRQHQVEVTAQPLTSDGQPVGATKTIRLATQPFNQSAPIVAEGNLSIRQHNIDRQAPPIQPPQQQTLLAPAAQNQPQPPGFQRGEMLTPISDNPQHEMNVKETVEPANSVPGGKSSGVEPPRSEPLRAAVAAIDDGVERAVAAKVAARTPAGQIILQAVDQLMRIEQPIDLPIGTDLHITTVATPSASSGQIDPAPALDQTTPLKKLIAALDDIDRVGRSADDAGGPNRSRHLPTPDRHLAAKFLNLVTMGPEQGLADNWLREPEQGTISLRQKEQIWTLAKDLGSTMTEPLADGWKGMAVPVGSDPAQAVYLYFREHQWAPDGQSSEADEDGMDAKRAVFDVSFSHLGHCQIDALCQPHRFDLLVRSERTLAYEDQQEITSLFNAACEISGMKGEIGFREGLFFEPAKKNSTTKIVTT